MRAAIDLVGESRTSPVLIREVAIELSRLGQEVSVFSDALAIQQYLSGPVGDIIVCFADLKCVTLDSLLDVAEQRDRAFRTRVLVVVDPIGGWVPEVNWTLNVDGYVVASHREQVVLAVEQLMFRASPGCRV